MITTIALLIACATGAALGASDDQALTITGTPTGITVTDPDGTVRHYTPRQVRLLNHDRSARPAETAARQEDPKDLPSSKPGPEPVDEPPAAAETGAKELTPEQVAKKEAAVAEIQAARQLGGAYFYTEDDRPISGPELSRMIESGDFPNIKVVDLFQQRRTFDFKAIEDDETSE